MLRTFRLLALGALALVSGCDRQDEAAAPAVPAADAYDVVIRGGTIYDGSGGAPYVGELAIRDDRIAAVGDVGDTPALETIDAASMAVSPGFINLTSHAQETIQIDGRARRERSLLS
jgi:N-acyl-D-amino-acid deacylase